MPRRGALICEWGVTRDSKPPPSQFEAWFVSLAHTDQIIEETIEAAEGAFEVVAGR